MSINVGRQVNLTDFHRDYGAASRRRGLSIIRPARDDDVPSVLLMRTGFVERIECRHDLLAVL